MSGSLGSASPRQSHLLLGSKDNIKMLQPHGTGCLLRPFYIHFTYKNETLVPKGKLI